MVSRVTPINLFPVHVIAGWTNKKKPQIHNCKEMKRKISDFKMNPSSDRKRAPSKIEYFGDPKLLPRIRQVRKDERRWSVCER